MGANRSQVPGGGVAGPPSLPTPTLPSAPAAAPSLSSSARAANGLGPTRRAAAQRSHAMGPRKAASTTATTKTPIVGTASAHTGNGPLPPPDAVPFWSDDRSYGVQSTTTGDIFMTYPGFQANRPIPPIPGATGPFSGLNTTPAAPPGKRKEKDVGNNNRPLAGNKTRSNAIIPPLSDFGGAGGAGGKNSMSMPSGSIDPMGDSMSLDGMSDTSERSRDGRHDGQSGKKRKVPSSLQTLGRDEAARDLDGQLHEDDPLDGDVDDQFEPNEGEEPSASRSRPNAAQTSAGGGGTGSGKELYIDNGDTGDRGDQDYHTRSSTGNNGTAAFPRKFGRWTIRDPPRSRAALACGWKKALFLKRKAALITLFLDAQTAINQALTAKLPASADSKSTAAAAGSASVNAKGKDKPSVILPEVEVFEAMMPALEDIGVGQWPLDQPGWRTGVEVRDETRVQLEKWRTTYDCRRRELAGRKKVVRGGWAPEGSFEFEVNSKPSRVAQSRAKDHASLRKLIVELRAVTLNATKLASVQKTHAQIHDKTQRQPARGDHGGAGTGAGRQAVSGQIESMVTTSGPTHQSGNHASANKDGNRDANRDTGADKENVPMSSNGSSQGSEETTTGSGKKKQKKKKRSVLANQSNPHHVDNYRPSRIPGTHGDPLEPYPWHDNLLFPPSMAFLSARPASRTRSDDVQVDAAGVAPMTVRPAEDDYLCTFCEYALYYGTEAERKRAIRMRRRELKRKQTIKNRARNVAEGKGKGNLGREEEDEEEWDEEDGCEDGDGCTGRCS